MWWNLPEIFEAIRDCFTNIFNFILEILERSKLMFIRKREYERLEERIAELEAAKEELKGAVRDAWEHYYALYEDRAMFTLKDYDVAVLWPKDKHTLKVWNKGRFEEGVRAVVLGQEGIEYLPQFTMQK